jgi:hypothetical protein
MVAKMVAPDTVGMILFLVFFFDPEKPRQGINRRAYP